MKNTLIARDKFPVRQSNVVSAATIVHTLFEKAVHRARQDRTLLGLLKDHRKVCFETEKYLEKTHRANERTRSGGRGLFRKLKDGEDDTESAGKSSSRDILGEVEAREPRSRHFH